jgi:hypothetical protein
LERGKEEGMVWGEKEPASVTSVLVRDFPSTQRMNAILSVLLRCDGMQELVLTLQEIQPWCPPQTINSTSPPARATPRIPRSALSPPHCRRAVSNVGGVMVRAVIAEGVQFANLHLWSGSGFLLRCAWTVDVEAASLTVSMSILAVSYVVELNRERCKKS